jgi:hypothetical protein
MNKSVTTPLIPISWGELIDKITILEIKQLNIKSPNAQSNIEKELGYLNEIVEDNGGLAKIVKEIKEQLLNVNMQLWQVEDDIRNKELKQEFDTVFIGLARSVYKLNDDRAKIKKQINKLLNSELTEEKSYGNY